MIWIYWLFALSIYVPYTATDNSTVEKVNTSELCRLSEQNGRSIGLGIYSKAQNRFEYERFHLAAEFFDNGATFYEVDTESALQLAVQYGLDLPCLFFYDGGFLIACYAFPKDENIFSFLIDSFVEQDYPLASSIIELNSYIGNIPLTIITTQENLIKTKKLVYESSVTIGPINIVIAVPDVFYSIGFSPDKPLLFRSQDSMMIEAAETAEGLSKQINPVFRFFKDIPRNDVTIFALVAPSITDEYIDFLYEVGIQNPDFEVGFLKKEHFLNIFQIRKDSNVQNFMLVFNRYRGYRFDDGNFFTDDVIKHFNFNKWVYLASQFLDNIRQGQQTPMFTTEVLPNEPKRNNCYKIVASTYEHFINDENHDTVFCYLKGDDFVSQSFQRIFLAFAAECENISTLKFGFINVDINYPKIPYPFIPNFPHVQIFPALNKSNSDMMRGPKDRDSLMRAIKRIASFDVPFDPPPPDKAAVAADLVKTFFGQQKIPEEELAKVRKYADEMNELFQKLEMNNSINVEEE